MPRWEYRKIDLNNVPRKTDDMDLLNDAGAHGWELVSITANNVAYLKRQTVDPPTETRAKAAASSVERK
jgi:hypothetical protein